MTRPDLDKLAGTADDYVGWPEFPSARETVAMFATVTNCTPPDDIPARIVALESSWRASLDSGDDRYAEPLSDLWATFGDILGGDQ